MHAVSKKHRNTDDVEGGDANAKAGRFLPSASHSLSLDLSCSIPPMSVPWPRRYTFDMLVSIAVAMSMYADNNTEAAFTSATSDPTHCFPPACCCLCSGNSRHILERPSLPAGSLRQAVVVYPRPSLRTPTARLLDQSSEADNSQQAPSLFVVCTLILHCGGSILQNQETLLQCISS